MNDILDSEKVCEQVDQTCGEEEAGVSRGVFASGSLATVRFTGKVAGAFSKVLHTKSRAVIVLLSAERDARLPAQASETIRKATKRMKRLRGEIEVLKRDLGICLAQNALEGSANPAEGPNAQELVQAVEAKKSELTDLDNIVESLARTVAMLKKILAAEKEETDTEAPSRSEDGKTPDLPPSEANAKPETAPAQSQSEKHAMAERRRAHFRAQAAHKEESAGQEASETHPA